MVTVMQRFLLIVIACVVATPLLVAQWQRGVRPDDVSYRRITSVTWTGAEVLAGTAGSGVMRLDVSDMSWSPFTKGIRPEDLDIVAIHATGDGTYAAAEGAMLYAQHGATQWRYVSDGLGTNTVRHLASSGRIVYAATVRDGIYRTTGPGSPWTKVSTRREMDNAASVGAIGTVVFAATDGGVYRSTDRGETWRRLEVTSTYTSAEMLSVLSDGTIYAIVLDGRLTAYRSADSGLTWTPAGTGPDASTAARQVASHGGTTILGAQTGGLYRSMSGGQWWEAINGGLEDVVGRQLIEAVGLTDSVAIVTMNNGDVWYRDARQLLVSVNDVHVPSSYRGITLDRREDGVVVTVALGRGPVRIEVYDIAGRLLSTITAGDGQTVVPLRRTEFVWLTEQR
jgi:hypothetical protein